MWLVSMLINIILCVGLSIKLLHLYQLNSYRVSWNYIIVKSEIMILLAGATSLLFQGITSNFTPNYLGIAGYFIGITPIVSLFIVNATTKKKVKIRFTNRMLRQVVTLSVLITVCTIIVALIGKRFYNDYTYLSGLNVIILPIMFYLSIAILYPIERIIFNKYMRLTKARLSHDGLIKIGITGSYAKTTVKNILSQMLAANYQVIATPESYNTPMGIAKASQLLRSDTEIFIAEMGARRLGDIKELTDLVSPSIGIITGIASQHLETFKSIENIIAEKSELINGLPKDGVAFYNGDSKHINAMYYRSMLANKHITNLNSGRAHLESIQVSQFGSAFMLCIGEEREECSTKLIGRHNLSNILLSASVSSYLGVGISEIAGVISRLNYEPHRMEIIKAHNGVTIIDDSYNCNVEGARCAIEALGMFTGKRVVVSQGIVEMGSEEDTANYNIGMMLCANCDILFAVGARGELIAKGMLDAGANPTKIIKCKDLDEAQGQFKDVLRAGDTLLIMNDLPDNY